MISDAIFLFQSARGIAKAGPWQVTSFSGMITTRRAGFLCEAARRRTPAWEHGAVAAVVPVDDDQGFVGDKTFNRL